METTSICWLAVFVLLIVIELATMGLTTIWFAGGAVAGFIASMLGANVVIQAVVFFGCQADRKNKIGGVNYE